MSSFVQTIENTPFESGILPIPFTEIINSIGKHFNHTTARSGPTGIDRNRETGDTEIRIASKATAKEVLQMLKSLKPIEGERKIEDISDFGRRLKDVGILLSKEEVVQNSERAKQLASDIYALGCSIRGEDLGKGVDISKDKLSNNTQAYKDELFLWAIGRDNYESKYAQNLYTGKRVHPVDTDYSKLPEKDNEHLQNYRQLLKFQKSEKFTKLTKDEQKKIEQELSNSLHYGVAIEQRELKAKRSSDTLRHKSLFLKYFVERLKTKRLNESTKNGLEDTFLSAAKQGVLNILTQNAWKNWKDNLKLPPKERHQYLDNKILEALKLTPGFEDESWRISNAVGKLARSERWKELTDIEKVRDIWDVCQSYKHAEAHIPTKAIEARELECQLKSFLAGNLIKIYISEVGIATWYEDGHTKLALRVGKTNYMFDANLQKERGTNRGISVTNGLEYYPEYGIGITPEINQALDKYFATRIEQTIQTEMKGFIFVGDFDKIIIAGILGNIALTLQDNDLAISLLRLVIEINPNHANAYNNLANRLPPEEAIPLYRKAIEINPNYADAYYNLAILLPPQEAIPLYRKVIEINPNYADAYYNLAILLPPQEAIPLYRKVIEINPNYVKAYYNLAIMIYDDPDIQTKENIEEGLRSINKALELWRDDEESNQTNHYKIYAPELKAYFEEKLAELKT